MPFHVVNLETLASPNSNLEAIGGYYPNEVNVPGYWLIDQDFGQNQSLSAGKTSGDGIFLDFTNKDHSASFSALQGDGSSGSDTSTQAESWFNTSDAKTARLIIESVYFK
jgi:hypothetical protein